MENNLFNQIKKFIVVGLIATIIDYVILIICKELIGINVLISSCISFIISLIFNYILSTKFAIAIVMIFNFITRKLILEKL